jgi:hypothetical protein
MLDTGDGSLRLVTATFKKTLKPIVAVLSGDQSDKVDPGIPYEGLY